MARQCRAGSTGKGGRDEGDGGLQKMEQRIKPFLIGGFGVIEARIVAYLAVELRLDAGSDWMADSNRENRNRVVAESNDAEKPFVMGIRKPRDEVVSCASHVLEKDELPQQVGHHNRKWPKEYSLNEEIPQKTLQLKKLTCSLRLLIDLLTAWRS